MNIDFRYGSKEELNAHAITPGSFYMIMDTQEIYFDTEDNQRIKMCDVLSMSNEEIDSILDAATK